MMVFIIFIEEFYVVIDINISFKELSDAREIMLYSSQRLTVKRLSINIPLIILNSF